MTAKELIKIESYLKSVFGLTEEQITDFKDFISLM